MNVDETWRLMNMVKKNAIADKRIEYETERRIEYRNNLREKIKEGVISTEKNRNKFLQNRIKSQKKRMEEAK